MHLGLIWESEKYVMGTKPPTKGNDAERNLSYGFRILSSNWWKQRRNKTTFAIFPSHTDNMVE